MSVILLPAEDANWTNPDITEPEHIIPMLKQYPAYKMKIWHISDEARNPRNDYADLIKSV